MGMRGWHGSKMGGRERKKGMTIDWHSHPAGIYCLGCAFAYSGCFSLMDGTVRGCGDGGDGGDDDGGKGTWCGVVWCGLLGVVC